VEIRIFLQFSGRNHQSVGRRSIERSHGKGRDSLPGTPCMPGSPCQGLPGRESCRSQMHAYVEVAGEISSVPRDNGTVLPCCHSSSYSYQLVDNRLVNNTVIDIRLREGPMKPSRESFEYRSSSRRLFLAITYKYGANHKNLST